MQIRLKLFFHYSRDKQHDVNLGAAPAGPPPGGPVQVQGGGAVLTPLFVGIRIGGGITVF